MTRRLDWDGLLNGRDLGGLPTTGGGRTRRGAVVRSEALDHLTAAGWDALLAHGVRTVLALTPEDEPDLAPRPAELDTVRVPLDERAGDAFQQRWSGPVSGTPLYYPAYLREHPEAIAEAVGALARARPGGVLVHCAGGRDRTGLVVLVLLAFAGVGAADIVADYRETERTRAAVTARFGMPDDSAPLDEFLAGRGTSVEASLRAALAGFDAAELLRAGGLTPDDLAALRARLLDPDPVNLVSSGG
ncbi:tyrosine-protein phosphatase [Saccharopolyspora sp. CA-218241]|uniref:tyrosine-protein phosphatase n=1 Tax=Saccharopolyspora sp. CA-218241 TaxID=3240027 RepID=UPI003D966510